MSHDAPIPDLELSANGGIDLGKIVVEADPCNESASRLATLQHLFNDGAESLIRFITETNEPIRHTAVIVFDRSPKAAFIAVL